MRFGAEVYGSFMGGLWEFYGRFMGGTDISHKVDVTNCRICLCKMEQEMPQLRVKEDTTKLVKLVVHTNEFS